MIASAIPKKNVKNNHIMSKIVFYILLAFLALIVLYPLVFIVNISLKTDAELLDDAIGLVMNPQFVNYPKVWKGLNVLNNTVTTVWITSVSVFMSIFASLFAAFPLARKLFKGSGKVYGFILVSMYLPGSLVATIILLKDVLFVYGTPIALILVWAFGELQMNIFMLYNFISGLPSELDDAAYIDGCGYFRYVVTIAMPLLIPIVMTLITFRFINCWNDFLGPYIYITDTRFRTLSTGLYAYMGTYGSQWNLYATAVFIVASPMVLLYLFAQRFMISGLLSGAIKG